MSYWGQTVGAGTRANLTHTIDINWQSGNQTSLHVNTYVTVHDTTTLFDGVGDANWNVNTAGSGTRGANFTYSWSNGDHGLDSFDITVNHDANGNCSVGAHAYVNGTTSQFGAASIDVGGIGLPRIALAPGIYGITADTITPTSARLGGEITGYGHGTSANMNMYYRVRGSSSWIDLGNQGDAAGYNYWNVTGLTPGVTYEYTMNVWNNNGDGVQSSVQTFKTQVVSGMLSVIQGLL